MHQGFQCAVLFSRICCALEGIDVLSLKRLPLSLESTISSKPLLAAKCRLSLLHSNECNVPSVPWDPKNKEGGVTQGVHGRDKRAGHVPVIHSKE